MISEEAMRNHDRIAAMREFIIDYQEDPSKYRLLTPDVLWNLMEWNVPEEDQDDGVVSQDASIYTEQTDDEYYEHQDAIGMLAGDLMDVGAEVEGPIEYVELGFIPNEEYQEQFETNIKVEYQKGTSFYKNQ